MTTAAKPQTSAFGQPIPCGKIDRAVFRMTGPSIAASIANAYMAESDVLKI